MLPSPNDIYLKEGENKLDVAMLPLTITTAIYGTITDAKSGLSVAGALIRASKGLWSNPEYFASDSSTSTGEYRIENVLGANHIEVSASGYETAHRYFSSPVEESQQIRINVALKPLPAPGQGVYTASVYYCYLQDCEGSTDPREWRSNWYDWCQWLVQYETNLIVNYIKSQGLAADMPIVSIEKVAVEPRYIGSPPTLFLKRYMFHTEVIQKMPSFSNADIHIVIGENNFRIGAFYEGKGTVMVNEWTLEQEVRAMEGEAWAKNLVYCELAHELGHGFHLTHCGAQNKPCPMAQMQITYDEWVNMGKRLWFCDISRPILLANWKNRTFPM